MKKTMGCLFLFVSVVFAQAAFAGIEVQALNNNANVETLANRDQQVSYYFGNTNLNMSSYASWVITNSGDEDIQLLDARLTGIMYSGSTTCQKVIPAKSKCQVDIRFSPFTEGYHSSNLDMIFDKGGNIYFSFWGYGVRWP